VKKPSTKTIFLIIILFLLTPILLMGMYLAHPEFEVGIVLVDNVDEVYGEVVKEGYEHYDDYFDARILPVRFTTENVRNNGPYFLNSDFFKHGDPSTLQKEYGVDIILFVTHHQINNWDEGGGGYCGEANPKTRSALMTVYDFMGGGYENDRVIKHIALHETFHVLGYTHNSQDRSGIMQYDSNIEVLDLVPFYEFQLPARAIGFWFLNDLQFGTARVIYQGIFALAMLPFMMGITITSLIFYQNLFKKGKGLRGLIIIIPVLFFLILIIVESFRYLVLFSSIVLLIPLLYHFYERGVISLIDLSRKYRKTGYGNK
jgi:predicted Zn-dependent protease